jgi:hypothetical protein
MRRFQIIETMTPVAKGRAASDAGLDDVAEGGSLFDAVLAPNRSLPNTGFAIIMW